MMGRKTIDDWRDITNKQEDTCYVRGTADEDTEECCTLCGEPLTPEDFDPDVSENLCPDCAALPVSSLSDNTEG